MARLIPREASSDSVGSEPGWLSSSPDVTIGLCVIGGGPTAIAALFEAKRNGISAVGIESATTVMSTFRAHTTGLVYRSPAWHFEIAGLPLDCREPNQCSREDVLHYFARLVNLGGLDIRTNWRCVEIVPASDRVFVRVRTKAGDRVVAARNVLITSWYRRRRATSRIDASNAHVPVVDSLESATDFAGKHALIVGGGMAGYEAAVALMMNGGRVTLAMGRTRSALHRTTTFATLVNATRSTVIENVKHVALDPRGAHLLVGRTRSTIACHVVIRACGWDLDQRVIRMLRRAGVLDDALATALHDAKQAPYGREAEMDSAGETWAGTAAANHPDLWEHLFSGRYSVRFAGGPLHLGSSGAGVLASISTGIIAVRSIAGAQPPPFWKRPLASTLAQPDLIQSAVKVEQDRQIAESIRPIRVSASTRTWQHVPYFKEPPHPRGTLRYLSTQEAVGDEELVAIADGTWTVGELADSKHLDFAERDHLGARIARLCYHNALTWLPGQMPMASSHG